MLLLPRKWQWGWPVTCRKNGLEAADTLACFLNAHHICLIYQGVKRDVLTTNC